LVWATDVGEGYAGAAVSDGRVFVPDYDVRAKEESLRCFSLDSGKELWRRGHQITIQNNHAYTRSVPAVAGRFVVSIGPKCHVMCLDAETGNLRWGFDLRRDFGAVVPPWYSSQCPLIDGTTAVLAPCGVDLMIGVDCATGKILWRMPNSAKILMSHASVVPMTLNGKKMYLYCGEWGRLVGISGEKGDAGRFLWGTTLFDRQIMIASPIVLEDGFLFVTAPYEGGSRLVQVVEEGGTYLVKHVWSTGSKEGFSSEIQTPIYYKRHIFGVAPQSAGPLKEQFVCMDPHGGGTIVWSSGPAKRFGMYEPYLLADGKVILMDKSGDLVLVKAGTEKFEELARAKIHDSAEAWAPMALVGGRLILRHRRQLMCLDLAE
jgi:outer membrane protein assembly factor BamB